MRQPVWVRASQRQCHRLGVHRTSHFQRMGKRRRGFRFDADDTHAHAGGIGGLSGAEMPWEPPINQGLVVFWT